MELPIKAERGRTADLVRLRILDDIREGRLVPGDKLTTETLAARYHVSRTPVREALIRLEQDGLAASGVNTGCVLRQPTIEELCEIYEIREALEGIAAERIARHGAPPELLAELRECCARRRRALTPGELNAADFDFHRAICRDSGSGTIRNITDNFLILGTLFSIAPRMLHDRIPPRRRLADTREHEAIVEAIAAGNGPLARKRLAAHISRGRRQLAALAGNPENAH